MPRNGSGAYTRPHDWTADADAGIDIRADRMDEDSDDFAQAISESIARDGQTTLTANIPFHGFKATGLALATTLGDALSYGRAASVAALTSTVADAAAALTVVNSGSGNKSWNFYPDGTSFKVRETGVADVMTFAAGGNVGIGVAPTTARLFVKGAGSNSVLDLANANGDAMCYSGTANLIPATGENAAAAMFYTRKDGTSGRSINAAGTVNAAGADYAEYERKAAGCGIVAKGQIIGFDDDGNVTDRWDDARSFGIKSTDPCLVGGDTWKGEEERAQVDRIAYSGKVPVNVMGATPGQYIMAVQDGEGIAGVATDTTGSNVVGRVRKILPDGRALVAVIIA